MQLLLTREKISGKHGAERRGRVVEVVIAAEGRNEHDCRNKLII